MSDGRVGRADAHLVRGSAFLLVAVALNGAGGFAFWLVAAWRQPSVAVGGAQELFTALMALTCLTSMGLPVAVARFSSDRSAEARGVFRWSLAYTAATSAIGACVLVSLAPGGMLAPVRDLGGGSAAALLAVLATGMSFAVLVEVRLMALRRWGWLVARVALVVGVRLPILWLGPDGWSACSMFLIVAGIPALSGLLGAAVLHLAEPGRHRWWRRPPADLPGLLRYSTVHFAGLVGAQGPMLLIPLVVALSLGSAEYAPFYIAWAVTQVAFVIPHMLGQAFLVEAAKSEVEDDGHGRVTLLLAGGTMVVAASASLVAAPLLGWSLGPEYRLAGELLPWLLLGCVPWAAASTVLAGARLRHDAWAVAAVTAAFFLGTIGGVALFAPSGGAVGAAHGWVLGNLATAAVAGGIATARRRAAGWSVRMDLGAAGIELETAT